MPMFDPMMTPRDWVNMSSFLPLTSAMTRIMVTDEESRTVVATAPVATPMRACWW